MHKNDRTKNRLSVTETRLVIVICILVGVIIIDTSIIKVYYFSLTQTDLGRRIFLFVLLTALCIGGQQLLLRYVKLQYIEGNGHSQIRSRLLVRIVQGVQYILAGFLILIILQMLLTSHYSLVNLIFPVYLSYVTATILIGILAARFISWYRVNKNSIILLYGLASAVITFNLLSTLGYSVTVLSQAPSSPFGRSGFTSPYVLPSPTTILLNYMYIISSIISFIISWLATSLLMRQYYHKVSALRYWVTLIIPLIYFLVQFQPLFLNLFSSLINSQPVIFGISYTLIFAASKPVVGIIFALAFWNISKRVSQKGILRSCVIMAGLGFLLLFVSNQAIVLVTAPYPPFGFATITFMGLASYLILLGISGAATSLSNDSQLRVWIRSMTEEQYDLLGKIGVSHMEQQIQKKVLEATRRLADNMIKESGVESSLEENDIKEYCSQVIAEIKNK